MSETRFISGDEAFAQGIRLARAQVISAYPITPQTIVVERLAEMVEEGQLDSRFIHVESEHSAMSHGGIGSGSKNLYGNLITGTSVYG